MSTTSTFMASSGDGYELQMGRWSRRLAEPFLNFVGSAPAERLLDVGCGTGCLSFAMARLCQPQQVIGIDVSPAYVEHATGQNGSANVTFQIGDACAIAFPDQSFDRTLSLLVLHLVPDARQAISEMRRVTKPGGVVGAAVWDARGGFVANRIFFDTAAALDSRANERRARNYTRPMTRPFELAKAWTAAGLTDVMEATLTIRMDYESFEDYWAPCEGKDGPQAEYVATLEKPARDNLKDAVRLAYVDGEHDGPRSFLAAAWAVRGVAP